MNQLTMIHLEDFEEELVNSENLSGNKLLHSVQPSS